MTFGRLEMSVAGSALVGDRWMGGGSAIVLLHAGVCDRRCWREVGERLGTAGCDVVAYDRRGFGEVPPADRPFRHVDDLLAVIGAVSPNAPAWLVGSSMGGEVALDAALAAPGRVAGLVLLAPAVGGDPELDEATFNAATNGLADAIDAAWTAGDLETCNQLEVRLWLDGPTGPEGRVSGPPRPTRPRAPAISRGSGRGRSPDLQRTCVNCAAWPGDEFGVVSRSERMGVIRLPLTIHDCARRRDERKGGSDGRLQDWNTRGMAGGPG